ncbi:MAG TPA: hypothetical protein VFA49_13505 [Chloroflexota bacterium]|nr:hypothetical protein [Chloroflexota bacterium]
MRSTSRNAGQDSTSVSDTYLPIAAYGLISEPRRLLLPLVHYVRAPQVPIVGA